MQWILDKKVDYFSNKKLSLQLREAALNQTRVFQFAYAEPDPGMQVLKITKGDVKIKRITPKCKIIEIGRAIQLPQDYVLLPSYDSQDPVHKHLVLQLTKTLDHSSMIALKQSSVDITTSTNILRGLIRPRKWTEIEALCSVASGYMCSCADPYDKSHYIGIGGLRFIRAIERHPKFLDWKGYLSEGDVLFIGEKGKTNNIRWINLNDTSLLRPNEGVVFGYQSLILKEVQTPNLRFSENMIAWYGILAFGGQNILHIPERKNNWR